MKGFGNLQTPEQLVDKAERDLRAARAEWRTEEDQAFDIAMTLNAAFDWFVYSHGSSRSERSRMLEQLLKSEPVLKAVADLCNGGKHFIAKSAENVRDLKMGHQGVDGRYASVQRWHKEHLKSPPYLVVALAHADQRAFFRTTSTISARELFELAIHRLRKVLNGTAGDSYP